MPKIKLHRDVRVLNTSNYGDPGDPDWSCLCIVRNFLGRICILISKYQGPWDPDWSCLSRNFGGRIRNRIKKYQRPWDPDWSRLIRNFGGRIRNRISKNRRPWDTDQSCLWSGTLGIVSLTGFKSIGDPGIQTDHFYGPELWGSDLYPDFKVSETLGSILILSN